MSVRLVITPGGRDSFRQTITRFLNWQTRGGPLVEEKAGDFIRQRFTRNFEAEGYPDTWPALAPRTVADRRKLGFGGQHMILQRTRELKRSVVERGHPLNFSQLRSGRGRLTLTLGSNDPRFAALHAGTDHIPIPARPMTVLGESDLGDLDEVVFFVIMQAMGEA